jgi:glycosyltransferase involved in cell wall biosynthesis
VSARRILLATYFYPPDRSVGSHRWPPIVRHLRARGHEVTVLTTSAFGSLPDDRPWVLRTRDLQASPLLRRALRRPAVIPAEGRPSVVVPPAPRLLTDVLVPDAHVASWLPFAAARLRRVARERSIECVITNGPPDAAHLAALALGRDRPAWIADFEDGWRFEPQREGGWPTRAQDRLDAALEARVVREADAVVGLSEPIAADFARRFGARAFTIPNAWDPEIAAADPPPLEPGTVSVVHAGNLSHATRRDPTALLAALELLADTPIRLVLAGRLVEADRRRLDGLSPRAAALVRHVGELDRPAAIGLQRAADVLLLLVTGPQRSVVTGKIFEYLAAGRPILAVSDENEATRIVRETRTGEVVSPWDPGAIAAALRRAAEGRLEYAPRGLDAYVHPGPAIAYEKAIEACLDSPR